MPPLLISFNRILRRFKRKCNTAYSGDGKSAISLDDKTDFAIAEGCVLLLFKVCITFFVKANNTVVTVILRTSCFFFFCICLFGRGGGELFFVGFFPPCIFKFSYFIALHLVPCVLSLESIPQIAEYKILPPQSCHSLPDTNKHNFHSDELQKLSVTTPQNAVHLLLCHVCSLQPCIYSAAAFTAKSEIFGELLGGTNHLEQHHSYFPYLVFLPYTRKYNCNTKVSLKLHCAK